MILSPSQEVAKTKISNFLKSYDISKNMFILKVRQEQEKVPS